MIEITSDLRIGLRMMRKRPGTSLLAITALALGIGLTTTMFSIVNGAVLRGLPFEDANRILHLARLNPSVSQDDRPVPFDDYLDWRERQRSFSDLAAFHTTVFVLAGEGRSAERLNGVVMTASTLPLLRTAPVVGRGLTETDERPGALPVALIGYRVWQDRFEGDPSVIGRQVRLDGGATTIVGVMPPRFGFPQSHQVWIPLEHQLPATRGGGPGLEVIGRLSDGVTPQQAGADLAAIAAQLAEVHPENEGLTAMQQPYMREFLGDEIINTLFAMLGAVFGVLLIACANVANLQLARAAERSREVAIRSAMGAGRWRIVRQMLVEAVALSTGGALVGLGIAWLGITLFNRGIVDTNPPFWIDIRLDPAVLLFVLTITLLAALLSSVLPAIRVTGISASEVLRDETRSSTGLRAGLVTRTLVVVAVTLSCGLLIVSGLMIKNVVQLGRTEYAFATDDVLIARTAATNQRFPDGASVRRVTDRMEAGLGALPGVAAVGLATNDPDGGGQFYLTLEGQSFPDPENQPFVRRQAVNSDYFAALRVTPLVGRTFSAGDRDGTLPVAVINRDFAAQHFPDGAAIGRRLRLGRSDDAVWLTVVGIVPALSVRPDPGEVTATVYVPLDQAPSRDLVVFLQAAGAMDPLSLVSGLRQTIIGIDDEVALFRITRLDTYYYDRNWAYRVFGTLFMSFGFAALVMATAGLYGVLSFGVRRRTPEIGLRMALGATRGRVIRLVLRQGLIYVGVGIVCGVAVALLLAPPLQELLNDVSPRDGFVFTTTTAVLVVTGLVASLLPALRAASVDPLVALRYD